MRLPPFLFGLAMCLMSATQSASANDWLTRYYEHPAPERFVVEVHALSKAGHLANPKTSASMATFLGRVMAANPAQIDQWLTQLADLKGADREALLLAANLSRTPAARAYLTSQRDAAKYRAELRDVRDMEPTDATVLDMLWSDFFATGEPAPVRRIVSALNYEKYAGALERYAKSEKTAKDREDAVRDAIFQAARWSLGSNARQHRRVGQILEELHFSGKLTQPEQLWLSAILANAMPDKYEFASTKPGEWVFKRR